MLINKSNILFLIVVVITGCKTISQNTILNQAPGKKIPADQVVEQRSDGAEERYYSKTGAEYLIQKNTVQGFNKGQPDGIAVIKIDNKFAVLQAKDVYLFSWFKKGNESDDITLQRAIEFIHYSRIEGKNVATGKLEKSNTISTSGTILIDRNITLKNTVEIYENIILKGDFTASNDNNYRSNTVFLDINNSEKPGIKFRRFPDAPDPPYAYVSAKIENLRLSALSPCRTAVSMDGASGEVMRNVMLSGNGHVENGFEMSFSIFCKISNVRVEKPRNYGFYYKPTPNSIGTTTELENISINGGRIGIFVDYKSNNSLWLKNCVVEMTESNAIKIEQYNTVHIDNLYTENVPNDLTKKGTIAIIEINTKNFEEPDGNKGMVTISNSMIHGYHKEVGTRKIVGIYADNVDMTNVSGCKFSLVNQSIIMKSGCNVVNWFNNHEVGIRMSVYNALNLGDPIENGIEKPNTFNVFSAYSSATGTFQPYTKINSQGSRLRNPILLARNDNRLRFSEDSKDEALRFTEMWVQHGQQPGELRIAPGGQKVATTFGTNGGITVGNNLTSPPPSDGIRVHGQGVFGNGDLQKSAALQVDANDKGFLPPRLTTQQRDAIPSPAPGLIIFNVTVNKHQGYNGKIWNDLY
ncbi:MAG: hypothetical protein IPG18_02870 [Saprospiraceae bacterium]|nr:hypothetical protein [Saprospiraceae bacterium]